MEKEGIQLQMNGRPCSYREIAKAHMVAEKGCYMRDYIPDQKGGIAQIDFHYVNEDEKES